MKRNTGQRPTAGWALQDKLLIHYTDGSVSSPKFLETLNMKLTSYIIVFVIGLKILTYNIWPDFKPDLFMIAIVWIPIAALSIYFIIAFWQDRKKMEAADVKPEITPQNMQQLIQNSVDKAKSEFGDEAVIDGMQLLNRVNRLQSVDILFFQGLLHLTDDISLRVFGEYDQFGEVMTIEVHGFCASIVATAVSVVDLPTDEKPIVMDIYFDLWVDSAVRAGKNLDGLALKDRIVQVWDEYRAFIYYTEVEEPQRIISNPTGSAARLLVSNVDRLAGVKRDEVDEQITAIKFKSIISDAIRQTNELALSDT